MGAKSSGRSTPDPETFIPDLTGRVGIGSPEAMLAANREGVGLPPRPADAPRGAITDGRDVVPTFSELIREGKACAYALLQRATQQAFPYQWTRENWNTPWRWFSEERNGLVKSFKGDGGGNVYTATFDRAVRTWAAVVPRLLTDDEARTHDERERSWGNDPSKAKSTEFLLKYTSDRYQRHCKEEGINDPQGDGLRKYRAENFALPDMTEAQLIKHYGRNPWPRWYRNGVQWDQIPIEGPNVAGLPEGSKILATSAEVTTEERQRRWIEEFAAEVEASVDRFKDRDELPRELQRLIAEVGAFEVGQGEAKAFVEHLQSTAAGRDVLRKMADGRARLLLRLERLKAEVVPVQKEGTTGERLTWKGSTIEFITIVENVVKSRYTDLPSKGGKGDGNWTEYFRRLQQAFVVLKDNGEEFTAEGLANRRNGRPMGEGRAAQFELPEATRKKEGDEG